VKSILGATVCVVGMSLAAVATALAAEKGAKLPISVDGRELTTYWYGADLPKPSFHPLLGPYGVAVTRGYPMADGQPGESQDHRHHRGLWFAHGDVRPGDQPDKHGVDFWGEKGKIVNRNILHLYASAAHTSPFAIVNDYLAPDGKKMLEETQRVQVRDAAPGKLMTFEITLKASEGPIVFGDNKEGTFALRVADSMKGTQGGTIENSKGAVGEPKCWGKQAEWCDYSGIVAGKRVGVAIFDHPSNFRQAYWHVRGYGLFSANPFGSKSYSGGKEPDGSYRLEKDQTLTLRYAVYSHPGDVREGKVAERYREYAGASAAARGKQ